MAHPNKGSILITGANGGFGAAIVSHIVSSPELRNYHGIYTVRNAKSATGLDAALGSKTSPSSSASPHSSEKVSLDLASLKSVREVAASINSRVQAGEIPPIRALILNAGVEEFATQSWTKDGLDVAFATNYLGHWLLTLLLLESMDRERGRVIWITSWSHNPRDMHNSLNGAFKEKRYQEFISDDLEPIAKGTWSANKDDSTGWAAGYRRYGASKLCGVTMIHELQRRLDRDPRLSNISVLALDPGAMPTAFIRQSDSWFLRFVMFKLMLPVLAVLWLWFWPNGAFRTLQKSSRDVISAALECGPPPLSERPKGLFLNGSERGVYNDEAKEPVKGDVVWRGSVRYARLVEGETVLENWK